MCARCGKNNPPHYKLCLECGAAVTDASTLAGEATTTPTMKTMPDVPRLPEGPRPQMPPEMQPPMGPPPGVPGFSPAVTMTGLEQQQGEPDVAPRGGALAKKRTTWLLAAGSLALVATIALVFVAVERKRGRDAADAVAAKIAEERAKYEAMAREADDQAAELARAVNEEEQQRVATAAALQTAQTRADRLAAQARLEQLRKHKLEMELAIQAARAAAAKARRAGIHLTQECLDNPLATGCD
jgi:hypothetical protein